MNPSPLVFETLDNVYIIVSFSKSLHTFVKRQLMSLQKYYVKLAPKTFWTAMSHQVKKHGERLYYWLCRRMGIELL